MSSRCHYIVVLVLAIIAGASLRVALSNWLLDQVGSPFNRSLADFSTLTIFFSLDLFSFRFVQTRSSWHALNATLLFLICLIWYSLLSGTASFISLLISVLAVIGLILLSKLR